MGLLDVLRQRLNKIEQKVYAQSARIRSKLISTRLAVRGVDITNIGGMQVNTPNESVQMMKSSWIRSFAYDNQSHILYMTTIQGKTYSWDNISADIAWNCIRGNATCTTNDKKQRWWVGKNPSLGAAYWEYLSATPRRPKTTSPLRIRHHKSPILAKPSYNTNYMDIYQDVNYTKKAEQYYQAKKGAPNTVYRNWKRGLLKPWAKKPVVGAP